MLITDRKMLKPSVWTFYGHQFVISHEQEVGRTGQLPVRCSISYPVMWQDQQRQFRWVNVDDFIQRCLGLNKTASWQLWNKFKWYIEDNIYKPIVKYWPCLNILPSLRVTWSSEFSWINTYFMQPFKKNFPSKWT